MFGVGVQKKAEQGLTEFYQENALVIALTSINTIDNTTHEHHQMAISKSD